MAERPAPGFAGLLRQLRDRARLTQEELAQAAGISTRSVSDLERGINRTARKDTAELLAGALGLAEPVRALFVAAARGRAPAAEVLAAVGGSPRLAAARCGRGAPIWGWCHSRSGTRRFITVAVSWLSSWYSALPSGWMGRGSCWWPGSLGWASPRCCGRD